MFPKEKCGRANTYCHVVGFVLQFYVRHENEITNRVAFVPDERRYYRTRGSSSSHQHITVSILPSPLILQRQTNPIVLPN